MFKRKFFFLSDFGTLHKHSYGSPGTKTEPFVCKHFCKTDEYK